MLEKVHFKSLYNSKQDDVINDFYIPALSQSNGYDRISAYFDSKILRMYAAGLENIKDGGRVRFIFSCDLDEEDYNLMKQGYDLREKINSKLLNSISDEDVNIDVSNLAYLIAIGVVDIKIAFTTKGIFHDKYGVFSDSEGNKVYFRGSNNETLASIMYNYESFETSCSWNCDAREELKIDNAVRTFEAIWNDEFPELYVIPLPECVKEKLIGYSSKEISSIYYKKENCAIFDVDEQYHYTLNNFLDNKSLLDTQSSLYKYIIHPYVDSYISYSDTYVLKNIGYMQLNKLIVEVKKYASQLGFDVYVAPRLRRLMYERDIYIDKRKDLGIAIKHRDPNLNEDFEKFKNIISQEMVRELREPQQWDAYHIAKMVKSANFSVPGAGKTTIVYGAYAYLAAINKIDKIVMIGPKNSFRAWKQEFVANFGNKKELNVLDIQANNELDKKSMLKYQSDDKNLILVNYESVQGVLEELTSAINDKTLLVFDEIHRIKSVKGKRAEACLRLANKANYKVALTGTPLPNGYDDIYNMLNILFCDEYSTFFGFKVNYLREARSISASQDAINKKIFPFFCRTTKNDLQVPPPCQDDTVTGYLEMNDIEEEIFSIIYREYSYNTLILYVRLTQASSNPALLLKSVDKNDLADFDGDCDEDDYGLWDEIEKEDHKLSKKDYDFIFNNMTTRKIDRCCEIIEDRVRNGETVVAWGIYIDSLNLVYDKLTSKGVKAVIISGATPQEVRDEYINMFCNKEIDVLITNPHTLAESVSLHKTCHFAIYFEYDFNLTHMVQSRDRIHRLGLPEGQKTEYCYMTLNSKTSEYNTIDVKIYERLKEKERIMLEAVENNDIAVVEDDYMDNINFILRR